VWVQVELKVHNAVSFDRFEAWVQEFPEVTECVAVGGGVDYLMKVEAESIDAYQRLIDRLLGSGIGIARYFTYIVTKTVKQTAPPLGLVGE
ncbi:MAG TPA: Lrp/AsnC ligand binding domain-containing protein, partial [Halomonas sp.]|nr:Lrp/AsnC ligand binding domain-containing protein [Halomonas sp.]